MSQRYHIVYQAEAYPEGITKEKVLEGAGATDSLVLISMIYPPNGGLSTAIFSKDGRTGKDVDPTELFKAWSFLTKYLADHPNLTPGKKKFCAQVFEDIRKAILAGR